MRFIGRTKELATLGDAYAAKSSAFIPIYGRRRVGKSELILRFMGEHPGLYFVGKTAPGALQLAEFLREAARVLEEPLLEGLQGQGWKRALESVVERWPKGRKLVLALDEFQWTAEASPELLSALQELWDRSWKRNGRVLLILCGSFIGFMEREVLGRKSPLFGRRTAQIHLQPFPYWEAAAFHPRWSISERAKAYFLCGGVPLYLELFDPARSVEQNIEGVLLKEHSPLFREPEFLLREELRDIESYFAVLRSIATDAPTPRQIAERSGVSEKSLTYYLNQLVALGYIRRSYPLSERKPAARSVRYVLHDPLLRFWFRFVFGNLSYLHELGAEKALDVRIKPQLEAYYGSCFEVLCREALPRLYERERVDAGFEVGEYWSKSVQIDVVGLREDGWTDLGECKWGAYGGRPRLLAELEAKLAAYPNRRGATLGRRLFVRRLPAGELPPDARWHGLEELYELS